MLKKYYLFLLFFLLIYPATSFPGWFDDVLKCFDNLCNCGFGTVNEYWNTKVKRTIEPEPLCPPYNRRDGRDFDNCLIQFDPPQTWNPLKAVITADFKSFPSLVNLDFEAFMSSRFQSLRDAVGHYFQHCAESTSESTYFAPKIRIRSQSCLFAACWSQQATLNGHGDCIYWPGPYPPFTLVRVCARIALPAVPPDPNALNKKGTPADPGYTYGKHLNEFGATEDDKPWEASDGTFFIPDPPKLCAYNDPGIITLRIDDPMDYFPTNQPFHQTKEIHPIVKVLVFLMEQLKGVSLPNILDRLLEMLGAEVPALEYIPAFSMAQLYVKGIAALYDVFRDTLVVILKTAGELNRIVDSYEFGCVELPIGPFPPPYCPTLDFTIPSPTISNICSVKDPATNFFIQTSANPCVVSVERNNFINNAVRISMDNLIRLCKPNEEPNKCVQLHTKGLQASGLHTDTGLFDTITRCTKTNPKVPCFSTNIKCADKARIVYAERIGLSQKNSKPSNYYISDLPDCVDAAGSSKHGICQEVWGINSGEFRDVVVKFPEIQQQDVSGNLSLTEMVTLKDANNTDRNFKVSIARTSIKDDTIDPPLTRDPQTICVAEIASIAATKSELVGCIKRVADRYAVHTYPCEKFPGICSPSPLNSYYTPEFIAAIEVRDVNDKIIDSTKSVIAPLTVGNNLMASDNTAERRINLAGLTFSNFMAYISDDYSIYIAPPFSQNPKYPLTIYGEYKDGKVPFVIEQGTGKIIMTEPEPIYLKGLEYSNGKYIQGGTHGCLQPKEPAKCMAGVKGEETNCVLTKIIETDTIDCKKFRDKITDPANPAYQLLGICPNSLGKDHKNCTAAETIAGTGGGITIYSCNKNNDTPTNQAIYCYENNRKDGVEICKIAMDKANRLIPEPNKGAIINKKEEHFEVITDGTRDSPTYGKPINYNPDTQAVRDKTPVELGFCVPYPVPSCPAQPASPQNGNASWPETKIGDLAIGTCQAGLASPTPLKRYCLANAKNKTVKFEDLPPGVVGCQEDTGLKFKYTSTGFKPQFPNHYTGFNKSTKIATFLIGDDYGVPAASLYNTLNCINYEFEIPNTDELEYFSIGDNSEASFYERYLMIKVNNNMLYTGPHSFNTMTSSGTPGSAEFKIFIDGVPQLKQDPQNIMHQIELIKNAQGSKTLLREINIINKLTTGKNSINICIGTVESGILKLMMKYKLK